MKLTSNKNPNMNRTRKYLLVLLVSLTLLITIYLISRTSEDGERKKEEITGTHSETETRTETKSRTEEKLKSAPILVKNFGWKPIARIIPKPGYVWEWAVEIENQTPVTLVVQITYELEDENEQVVGMGLGGDNIPPKESRIILGKASAPENIEKARRQKVKVMASPLVKGTEWNWENPYRIIIK